MLRKKPPRNNDFSHPLITKLIDTTTWPTAMVHIIITAETKIDTARPNLTIRDIETLLPFTVTGIPENLSNHQREALSTLICQTLVPLRPSIAGIIASVKGHEPCTKP
jgi:hypothetical protein